jgi:hypothetical protein
LAPGGRLVLATWNGPDPRWSWERKLRIGFAAEIDPAMVKEMMAGLGVIERFDEPAKVEAELRAAGFTPELATEHALDFVFADEDAWWDWNWSQAARQFLEALPGDAQERFRSSAYEAMQACRAGESSPRTWCRSSRPRSSIGPPAQAVVSSRTSSLPLALSRWSRCSSSGSIAATDR